MHYSSVPAIVPNTQINQKYAPKVPNKICRDNSAVDTGTRPRIFSADFSSTAEKLAFDIQRPPA